MKIHLFIICTWFSFRKSQPVVVPSWDRPFRYFLSNPKHSMSLGFLTPLENPEKRRGITTDTGKGNRKQLFTFSHSRGTNRHKIKLRGSKLQANKQS